MKRALLIAVVAFAACAAQRAGGSASSQDCAVIGAVLAQHYQIEASSPYRLDRGDGPKAKGEPRFRINCRFAGIPVRTYDHQRPQTPPPNFQSWIKFPVRPTYTDRDTAIVEAGSLLGPLAGSGVRCTLKRDGQSWRVSECKTTWIS